MTNTNFTSANRIYVASFESIRKIFTALMCDKLCLDEL